MTEKTKLPLTGIPEDRVPAGAYEEAKDLIVEEATPYESGDGWSISTKEGSGFGMPEAPGIDPPEPGDRVRIYTYNYSNIQGMALRGTVVYFSTREEKEEEHRKEVEKRQAKEREEYEESGRAELQERYERLPEEFQHRLDKYRNGPNPDFGWQFESYEVFCCEQAVLFAERAKAAVAEGEPEEVTAYFAEKGEKETPPTPELRWLYWWRALHSADFDYDYERHKAEMPGFSDDHSGNTFGSAFNLAVLWLSHGEEGVVRRYGSLAPLVGSDAYGDPPAEPVAEGADAG